MLILEKNLNNYVLYFLAYIDSNSEDIDSDASGKEVDSDIENEKEISYDRKIYKEDLVVCNYNYTSNLKT